MHESRKTSQARWSKTAIAAALLLALSVGLSACGGAKGNGQNPKPSAPTPTPTPQPEPKQKIAQIEAKSGLPILDRMPTLDGLDADGDGVREDIAEYIEHKYTDPAQRRAAMQVARAYQAMLLVDTRSPVALQLVSEQSFRAIACLRFAFPGDEALAQRISILDELEAMTTNTKERLKVYLAYNKARSGSVSTPPEGNTCE